jgi:hypothetical protein
MRIALSILVVGALSIGSLVAQVKPQTKPAGGFEQLKKLVGEWEAKSPKEPPFTSTIRLVSNATALEEIFQGAEANQMVTLYHPDGNRVAVTHYCSAGNQPRMETAATSADQKKFDFSFVGITNLLSPQAGHMHHLVISIADHDHFSEDWTWRENGKDQVHSIEFTRKK